MAKQPSFMSTVLGVALAVKRIRSGEAQKIDPSKADDTAALMREVLTGDPTLAQEVLRLMTATGRDTLGGIVKAVTHENEDGCEDCAAKLNGMAEPLRKLLTAEHAETLISVTEKAMAQTLAAHGGDVKAAARAAAAEAGFDPKEYGVEEPESQEPTVFGGGQKQKTYLN